MLHAYRTSVHSSTGVSPFVLMFGRQSKRSDWGAPDMSSYDSTPYQAQITCKMAKLQDFVETNLVHSATKQQMYYNKHSRQHHFSVGDRVWLSIDPKYEGGWKVIKVITSTNIQIQHGKRTRMVHTNHLQQCFQPNLGVEEEIFLNGSLHRLNIA